MNRKTTRNLKSYECLQKISYISYLFNWYLKNWYPENGVESKSWTNEEQETLLDDLINTIKLTGLYKKTTISVMGVRILSEF